MTAIFQIYARDSAEAKMKVFNHLSRKGFSQGAANILVRLGMGRARAITLDCRERSGWDPMIYGRNIKALVNILDQFLNPDELSLPRLSVFNHSFKK